MSTEPVRRSRLLARGKVAVVTGGASGIGAAIASAYAVKGARVAILDLSLDAAAERARELGTDVSAGHAAFACDVSSPASVTAAVEQVREQFGRIDILVNSAGVAILAPAEELDLKAWEKTIAINLTGTFLMCQKVGSVMLEQGYGRVVNLASQAATSR